MTANQIHFQELKEDKRQHSLDKIMEQRKLDEDKRKTNLTHSVEAGKLAETKRHNLESEIDADKDRTAKYVTAGIQAAGRIGSSALKLI